MREYILPITSTGYVYFHGSRTFHTNDLRTEFLPINQGRNWQCNFMKLDTKIMRIESTLLLCLLFSYCE